MIKQIHRQWQMLKTIPRAPSFITIGDIQSELEESGYLINKRSIERDLKNILDSGIFPIDCDESEKPYRWSWPRNITPFDLVSMDSLTAISYLLVEQNLANALPDSVSNRLAPYFKQAHTVMDITKGSKTGWARKVRIIDNNFSLLPPSIPEKVMEGIYETLSNNTEIELTYSKRYQSEGKIYQCIPLGLVFKGGMPYLVASIEPDNELRQFAASRIQSIDKTNKPEKPVPNFDLDKYITEGNLGVTKTNQKLKFKAKITDTLAFHFEEQPLATDQVIKVIGQHYEIQCTVPDTEQFRWWLLSFGEYIKVTGPKSLVREMTKTIEKMGEQYNIGFNPSLPR